MAWMPPPNGIVMCDCSDGRSSDHPLCRTQITTAAGLRNGYGYGHALPDLGLSKTLPLFLTETVFSSIPTFPSLRDGPFNCLR